METRLLEILFLGVDSVSFYSHLKMTMRTACLGAVQISVYVTICLQERIPELNPRGQSQRTITYKEDSFHLFLHLGTMTFL